MRSVVVRGVVCAFLLAGGAGPALAGSPQYKDVCAAGCTYSSVQAAIDSITDSSATKVYTVFIDSGVLQSDNSITTNGKDYINFVGRGMGVSVLQASSNWYSRVANLQTPADFFDFSGSTNVTVSNLTIDARTTDPGNVSTTMLFAGAKVDPGTGGKILFESSEVQGAFYGMWDGASTGGGLVEIFNSKIKAGRFAAYVVLHKWHIFSTELRVEDGVSSAPEVAPAALRNYGTETTVWGSHIHVESSQPGKTYDVYAIHSGPGGGASTTVIGSTVHVKMTTTDIGASTRQMLGVFYQSGIANFVGTEFLYENTGGALSQGKLGGVRFPGGGTLNFAGCTFKDAGGSGGTSRTDLLVPPSIGTLQLRLAGTRVATVATLTGASVPTSILKSISALSTQRGVATFPGATTVAVSLPVTMPDTNYSVSLAPGANETMWVTNKTTTGFTVNSSKNGSTASVDWTIEGCTLTSSSCGF